MLNIAVRIALVVLGIAAIIVGTTSYYSEVIECLKRLKDVADYSIPALVAVGGVHQLVLSMLKKK